MQRFTTPIAITLLCAIGAPARARETPPTTLEIGFDQVVTGVINGMPVRYLMMPSAPGTLVLSPQLVEKLAIKAGPFGGEGSVGPIKLKLETAVISYAVATQGWKRRVLWFDRPFAPDVDGTLGPNGAPQDIVIFRLRPPSANERAYTLPLTIGESSFGVTGTTLRVGDQDVFVTWDFARPDSLATAATAADLSAANSAQLEGTTTRAAIRLGVERPVRRLKLAVPLRIGPMSISSMLARVSDYADARMITDADATPDSSEIVVTGKGNKSKPLHDLRIGTDAVAGCSSITFDKRQKTITLSCRPE